MIRFTITLGFALLGSLIASPSSIAQEPTRTESTDEARALEAAARLTRAKAVEAKDNDNTRTERIRGEIDELIVESFQNASGQGGKASDTILNLQDPNKTQTITKYFTAANKLASTQDALESNFGLKLSDADDALRAQLELPQGQGVVVIEVMPGGLAEQAGLKANDVLLSLGDEKAGGVDQAKKTLLGLGQEALEVKLIREGKSRRMSLVGPKHGFPPETAQYWIGVPVSPVDPTLRAHLPSLAADAGLIVNDVVKGSPADGAGVQKNDILVTLGGKPLKTADNLIEQIQAAEGKPTPLEILRAGKPSTISVTPAKRAHPTPINVLSHPNLQYRFIAPRMGVETHDARVWDLQGLQNSLTNQPHTFSGSAPFNLNMNLRTEPAPGDSSTARIEAQLKEITAQLEQIRKSIDGLRKPEAR